MNDRFVSLESGKVVVMGKGDFSVGGCICSATGLDGIVYFPLEVPRIPGTDTTDIFPIGSLQTEPAAVIYFTSEDAIRQSIDVLREVLQQHLDRKAQTNE